ncbi:MAG: gliding motility protein GldM [Phycisphaerales bacterium]|nr:gliding motility protein GldM [Phycisphaerales bacterium]
MSIPKEPRQIMINLMYLVLTALLALNVSNEILAAFRTINKSIASSNISIDDKNASKYQIFKDNMNEPALKEKTEPFFNTAMQVQKDSKNLVEFLENWKLKVIKKSGGWKDSLIGEIDNEGDLHASTDLLVEGEKGGEQIKKRLQEYRASLLKSLNETETSSLAKALPLKIENPRASDANPRGDWTMGNFYNMPVIATVTLMSKFQNDIKNSEAMIIDRLFDKIHEKEVKFDDFKAVAIPKQNYLLEGQKIEADILLAAYKTTLNPTVSAAGGGGHIAKIEQGVAHWEGVASGKGLQTVSGKISLDMGGKVETREYKFEYMVGSTGASMQLDKMNVFYIGVPNPVTVSAAGYSMEDIELSIPGSDAVIAKGDALGKYNIMLKKQGNVMAVINARTKDQGLKQVGSQEIRVKMIPDPVAEVGGRGGSFMEPSNRMKVYPGINAAMKNFDFNVKFLVTSFDFTYLQKRQDPVGPITVSGPMFSSNKQVSDLIAKCKPGDKIFLENIKARGPDGVPRTLNAIIITIQ